MALKLGLTGLWRTQVGDRTATTRFYRDALLLEPLRHEEVREGVVV